MSDGGSSGTDHHITRKTSFLAHLVSEFERTGDLDQGPADLQRERLMQQLHGQQQAECIVSVLGRKDGTAITVAHVAEPFANPHTKWLARRWVQDKILAQHAYNFVPVQQPELMEADTNSNGACATNGQQHRNGPVTSEPGIAREPFAP